MKKTSPLNSKGDNNPKSPREMRIVAPKEYEALDIKLKSFDNDYQLLVPNQSKQIWNINQRRKSSNNQDAAR